MSLPEHTRAAYVRLIDNFLSASDLDQVTIREIRDNVQAGVDHDIEPHKKAIKALIIDRFDWFRENPPSKSESTSAAAHTNGSTAPLTNGASKPASKPVSLPPPTIPAKRESPSDVSSFGEESQSPAKVKKHSEEDDAAYAARLQAELNNTDRPTRGGPRKNRASSNAKRTPKKKSSSKVKMDDDSDVDSESEVEDKPKRNGAFHKPMALSEPLQRLTGETQLSRPQTVKKIWDYVKANDLQNPDDKRQIRCDDTLRAIFKQDSVHMFTMNKILSKNLYPVDE